MPSAAKTITLGEIWAMLDACAPGWVLVEKTEYWQIHWNNLIFPNLPKGPHGRKTAHTEIERGYARRLARFFNIVDCAKSYI